MRRRLLLVATAVWPAIVSCRGRPAIQVFETRSDIDGSIQRCTWLPPAAAGSILVISLPTWGGSHQQADPLVDICSARGWGYLRPNVRAPNRTPEACLSRWVINDLELASKAAARLGGPYARRVIVGESGGGFVALGAYLHAAVEVERFIVWNPIADLADWFRHAQAGYPALAQDILACTSSTPAHLDQRQLRERSPLGQLPGSIDRGTATLELYAGIHDGHAGSVPITQTMRFYNALQTLERDRIPVALFRGLAERDPALLAAASASSDRIGGRPVVWRSGAGRISLTIFDGAHESFAAHTAARIADTGAPTA